MDNDKISVVFEVTDTFAESETVERTRLEKDTVVVSGHERHIDKLIDLFVLFLQNYGFQKKTVMEALQEAIDEWK